MSKKIVSSIILTLLLIGMLTFVCCTQLVKAWTGTVYIHANGDFEPSDAPINRNGNVYTLIDNINSNASGIIIERDSMTLDGAGYTIQGPGSSTGVSLDGRSNVTIKNVKIQNFYYGIYCYNSSGNTFSGNNITGSGDYVTWGIMLHSSSNNSISENYISNFERGIQFYNSSDNRVFGNNITANLDHGMLFSLSSNNSIYENSVTLNKWGIAVGQSSDYNNVYANYIANNTARGFSLYDSTQNAVSGNNITQNNGGVMISSYSSYENLIGNSITRNSYGVIVDYASHVSVIGNNIANNNGHGVDVTRSSYDNICANNVTANNGDGIRLGMAYSVSSTYNNIVKNYITNNDHGVFLNSSADLNTIRGNTMAKNAYGIWLGSSSNNTVYHNNFINNTDQFHTYNSANFWDYGYPTGGNYWSDYLGVDNNNDGIGDTPYAIYTNNVDRYPLMSQWDPVRNVNTGLFYPTIQEAIDTSKTLDGHTLMVEEGTYCEHIVVDKSISLIGKNKITTIIDGSGTGTVVSILASNVKISGFTIRNGGKQPWTNFGACVQIMVLSNNSIVSGNILKNSTLGIEIDGVKSLVTDNLIEDNYKGIDLLMSMGNNTFVGNTVKTSIWYGVEIIYSSNNTIFHNNFIDNNQSTYSTGSINAWDNGWEGNHWSDYMGVDLDHDGIGDSPYTIFSTTAPNQDRYPLMIPYIAGDYNHDGTVNMTDAELVEQAWQSREGERSYNPHADFNMDGIINIKDAAIIGVNWLKKWEN
jgi:parallel beta-helix repeat protein